MFLHRKSFADALGSHTRQVTAIATIELSPISVSLVLKTMLLEKALGLGRSHGGRGMGRGKSVSQGTSPELCDQAMAFSDPLSHFTDLSFSAALKEEQRLDNMLLDDTVSPFGTDPLLSATSPAVSKESSRRSSFSSEDGDEL